MSEPWSSSPDAWKPSVPYFERVAMQRAIARDDTTIDWRVVRGPLAREVFGGRRVRLHGPYHELRGESDYGGSTLVTVPSVLSFRTLDRTKPFLLSPIFEVCDWPPGQYVLDVKGVLHHNGLPDRVLLENAVAASPILAFSTLLEGFPPVDGSR